MKMWKLPQEQHAKQNPRFEGKMSAGRCKADQRRHCAWNCAHRSAQGSFSLERRIDEQISDGSQATEKGRFPVRKHPELNRSQEGRQKAEVQGVRRWDCSCRNWSVPG